MKKLIIIGGGFAGAKIAKALEKRFDVILIDSKDYFEFTPSVLRTIVEPEHIKKIQVLHSHYLKKTKIINACVTELKNSYVKTDKNKKYYFDYLVIASGSRYQFPFKEQNIVLASRASHLRNCYEKLCLAKNIVLVGGGIVGVELTAEIANAYSDKNITLIEAGKGLMSRNHNKSAEYVKKYLEKNKVNLIFNEKVKEAKNKKITTNKGRKIKADMIFLCTGITPNSEFIDKKYLNKRKQTLVNDFLQVDNLKNVFDNKSINNVCPTVFQRRGQYLLFFYTCYT